MHLGAMNRNEAASLPFGMQHELLKLSETINEKLGKSSKGSKFQFQLWPTHTPLLTII